MSIGVACRCGGVRIDGKCDRCGVAKDNGHKWRHLYKTARWKRARLEWLANNAWCVTCARERRTSEANTVDHIEPHRGDLWKFWDVSNWQSMCQQCHAVKSGKE